METMQPSHTAAETQLARFKHAWIQLQFEAICTLRSRQRNVYGGLRYTVRSLQPKVSAFTCSRSLWVCSQSMCFISLLATHLSCILQLLKPLGCTRIHMGSLSKHHGVNCDRTWRLYLSTRVACLRPIINPAVVPNNYDVWQHRGT